VLVCNDRDAVGPVLETLHGYTDPAAHARLAAMRANHERYAAIAYGSDSWKHDLETLRTALQAPPEPFELDGNV